MEPHIWLARDSLVQSTTVHNSRADLVSIQMAE